MAESLLVERSGGCVVLTLNRPERRNALDPDLTARLLAALREVAEDHDAAVLVLTGTSPGFCAGYDLKDEAAEFEGTVAEIVKQEIVAELVRATVEMPIPVVAAIGGPAIGAGLGLALAADLRICTPSATFGVPTMGYGMGGAEVGTSWLLPKAVPRVIAAEMTLLSRTLTADEALRYGLVNRVVAEDVLLSEAREFVAPIVAAGPLAAHVSRSEMRSGDENSFRAAVAHENLGQVLTSILGGWSDARDEFRARKSGG